MKNKELLLRRMESIENRLKVLRNALNERDLEKAKLLKEYLESIFTKQVQIRHMLRIGPKDVKYLTAFTLCSTC